MALYVAVGALFLRSRGHLRWQGWSDHHIAHYCVTTACLLHAWFIHTHCHEVKAELQRQQGWAGWAGWMTRQWRLWMPWRDATWWVSPLEW